VSPQYIYGRKLAAASLAEYPTKPGEIRKPKLLVRLITFLKYPKHLQLNIDQIM
jgi:hypothetical protein